jgi:hypothetical protein
MNRRWVGLALAGAAMTVGACASTSASTSGNPTAQRVEATQQQSQQALDRASEAQSKASQQAQRAADAQYDVQKEQQALMQAQDKARAELQKAAQLQNEANQERKQANQTSQKAQASATVAIQQQGQQLARGQLSTTGQVMNASANRVTLRQRDGSSMSFQVNGKTKILIDGQRKTAAALQPGEEANIMYQLSGTEPLAVTVQAASGVALGAGQQ